MKLVVDAHTHTVASDHAYSTILENVEYAKKNGIKMIGWTDHAHRMTDGAHRYHFWNLKVIPRVVNGVIVLKGAEANIMDDKGNMDIFESDDYNNLEIIVASIHSSVMPPVSKEYHTDAYVNAIKSGRINVIGHPDDFKYDFDVEAVALVAKQYNVAIEINNSSMNIGRSDEKRIGELLRLCEKYEVNVCCSSDAHFAFDIGNFTNVRNILDKYNFPERLVLNTSVDKFLNFLGIEEE